MADAFPIVTVSDIAAARRLYEALGFVEAYRFPPDGEPGYVSLERGTDAIGLAAASPEGEHPGTVACWVYVDDVDAAVERSRALGAVVVAEPVDQPWGERQATVRDVDGVLLHLGSRA